MGNRLFVANLSANVVEEELLELFNQYGQVQAVEFFTDEKGGKTLYYAIVEMDKEKTATRASHGLNGYKLNDLYMAVSHPELPGQRELTSKQQKTVESIASELNETDEKPIRMITAIVMLCGTSYAEALVREAKEVEAAGGIERLDNKGKRTLGGVFFFLARYRMSVPVRKVVYNRRGKMPQENPPEEEAAEEEAAEA